MDVVIHGGQVVTPAGVGMWDIGIDGEKIVALAAPGTLADATARVIDATGKIVVPGGIEAHAHVAAGESAGRFPGNAGPADQTRSAIWGGTTTVMDFCPLPREGDMVEAAMAHDRDWHGNAYTDYGWHCIARGGISTAAIAQVSDLISAGFPSFKVYTTSVLPPSSGRESYRTSIGEISALMTETAAHGGIVLVHGEDDEIVQFNYATAQERGLWDWYNMHLIHTHVSEDLAFRRVVRLAEHTGAGMYFVHVSAKEGVQAIIEAQARGLPVYGEALTIYLCFNCEDYKIPDGMKYHTYPSLKYEDDRVRMWEALVQGDLAFMATDSIATPYLIKTAGRTVADVAGGNIGMEIRMAVTYSEGVVKRQMSLERYVDVTSTNVARLLGMYPEKGVIAPGSDADIVLIDPSVRKRLSMNDLHIQDYSPWEGWEIEGWPVTVMLRGKVMVEEGKLLGELTDGKLLRRKIDSSVLTRPAL